MNFKEFKQWCSDRLQDGCWCEEDAIFCVKVLDRFSEIPFWRRGKLWRKINYRMEYAIISPTNRRIIANKEVNTRTKGDRFRAMSDEELAVFFTDKTLCPSPKECGFDCAVCWFDWLKQPTEEK